MVLLCQIAAKASEKPQTLFVTFVLTLLFTFFHLYSGVEAVRTTLQNEHFAPIYRWLKYEL